jgi:hypothetical protein
MRVGGAKQLSFPARTAPNRAGKFVDSSTKSAKLQTQRQATLAGFQNFTTQNQT